MTGYVNYNGKVFTANKALITADNRGLRYGDGLFETMKMIHGEIRLAALHFQRLMDGLEIMAFEKPPYFTPQYLSDQILNLSKKNKHEKLCRVRLMIFRGSGGLYDAQNHFPNFIIETFGLQPENNTFPENGLVIGIYPDCRKAADRFSHLKSNNFLPYLMAAIHAKQQKLNDCLLLNSRGNICDSTIANCFVVKNKQIYTPPLSEGCVAGVMRRYLLDKLPLLGFTASEKAITPEELQNCEEMFLTNSIKGIRWVKQCTGYEYAHAETQNIFESIIREISR